jgi:plastocyanin
MPGTGGMGGMPGTGGMGGMPGTGGMGGMGGDMGTGGMGGAGGGMGGAGGGSPVTCDDQILNGDETDIDCGGSCPNACPTGLNCIGNADCASSMCYEAECVASVNGCNIATAVDMTSLPTASVSSAGLAYTPKCIKVSVGTDVTFTSNFANHPLLGGMHNAPASSGPFVPVTNTGTTKTFDMTAAGTYPYVCTFHSGSGMTGAVFVVP